MSAKRFGEIMRDTMGGAGPGPGWSRWWKATDEATWLSLMPPVVKMVYDKEIDLAPDGTLMPLWKVSALNPERGPTCVESCTWWGSERWIHTCPTYVVLRYPVYSY